MSIYSMMPQGILGAGYAADPSKDAALRQLFESISKQSQAPATSASPAPSQMDFGSPMGEERLPTQVPSDLAGPMGEAKRPGFLGRIKQQPGGSKALLAFGASMLSNPDFFAGLGNGAMAYQATLDSEAEKLRPQLTKDSTFSYKRNTETGEMDFKRTPVADYEEGIQGQKLLSAQAIARLRDDGSTTRNDQTLSYRDKWASQDNDYRNTRLEAEKVWRREANDAQVRAAQTAASAKIAAITRAQGGKPPPAAIQAQVTKGYETIVSYDATLAKADRMLEVLGNGQLNLSLTNNLANKARNATGVGMNDEAVLYSELDTFIETLRNTVLMDAKGVQTDGDAERARASLISGTGNNAAVEANLKIVRDNMRRRREYTQGRVDDISNQYNVQNTATEAAVNPPARGRSNLRAKYGLE